MSVLVVGGGVSGLTTALALLEAGWPVTVMARAWAPDIVSSVAAAIWHPYQVAHPQATAWATVSAERFRALAARPDTGVRSVTGWQLHRRPTAPPEWAGSVEAFRPLAPDELPDGFVCGFAYGVPLIETPLYMKWLRDEVARRGGQFEERALASLAEVAGEWPAIVNCTGLGARELVGDEALFPIRGQIVRVAPGQLDRFVFDDDDDAEAPTYLIPRLDGTIVGGTALAGDWELAARPPTTEAILLRARRLVPAIAAAPVLEVLVGLRPGRPTVRLEAETLGGSRLVHNYGHGGAGFTLSWGCAAACVALVEAALRPP